MTTPPSPRGELTQFADLILEAAAIQRDLCHRIAKRPGDTALRRRQKEYRALIERLVAEYGRAFDRYVAEVEKRYAQFLAGYARR